MKVNRRVLAMAIAFEAALGMLGWAIARAFDVPLAPRLVLSAAVLSRAAVALLPMLALLWFGLRTKWGPMLRLREQVESLVGRLFAGARWWALAAVAFAAGVGEELLFRGALQPLAERPLGPTTGLAAISFVFGALHAASAAYFVLATLYVLSLIEAI